MFSTFREEQPPCGSIVSRHDVMPLTRQVECPGVQQHRVSDSASGTLELAFPAGSSLDVHFLRLRQGTHMATRRGILK